MLALKRLRNSFRSTARYVYVPRVVISRGHGMTSPYFSHEINPAVALTSRGSVALSVLPVLSEADVNRMRKEVLSYDFSAN